MKTETLFDPKYILATYTDKDDLLFYLKSKFESPSIDLYINGHGEVTGFTCASSDGRIYSTLNRPAGRVENYNFLTSANDKTKELLKITETDLSRCEHALFFMKVGFLTFLVVSCWMFIQYHEQRNTIEKLKTEISKPVLKQDTI